MEMARIRVRKEVVQCAVCKKPKDFIYLSDFAYGERLIFSDKGMPCAFVSLLEDEVYVEYEKLVRQILKDNQKEIEEDKLLKLLIETFSVTCDQINDCKVDFSQNQKKCCFCGSTTFGRNMIEPESVLEIEIPLVSHNEWMKMEYDAKYELVKTEIV